MCQPSRLLQRLQQKYKYTSKTLTYDRLLPFLDVYSDDILNMSVFNLSSAIQCFECANVIKIQNGIMFNFYLGLQQMFIVNLWVHSTY